MENKISFKIITHHDTDFLYELLLERDVKTNISHKIMPSFKQHTKFVMSKPYLSWNTILLNEQKIGSIYLSRINEIGLHLKKDFQDSDLEQKIISKFMKDKKKRRYLINVSPHNRKRTNVIKKLGFNLIQHTYEKLNE